MSDEKKYTEREVVRREREAVDRTVDYLWPRLKAINPLYQWPGSDNIRDELYPPYKVTRPRVVPDPHAENYEWSVRNDLMQFRWTVGGFHEWQRAVSIGRQNMLLDVTQERVALWADLYANPTEEVEAES